MKRFWVLFLLGFVVAVLAGQTLAVDKHMLRWMRRSPVIKKIIVEGNSQFSTSRIKDRMYSRERSVWYAIKGERRSRLQRETLHRDTLELKYLYLRNGYLDTRISEKFEMDVEDSSIIIRVHIDEGRLRTYGERTLEGEYPRTYNYHFTKLLKELQPGDPIDPFELNDTKFKMKEFMANRGFPYAVISHELHPAVEGSRTDVVFNITADSVVHFGKVTVEGANKYPDYVALRELKIKEGNIYRREDILESQRRLYESGFYSSFTLTPDSSRGQLKPDFNLKVRERKEYFVTTTTGPVGQSQVRDLLWSFTVGGGTRGLFGSRRLSASADYFFSLGKDSQLKRHIYSLQFTEPWFLGLRMPLTLAGEYRPKIKSEKQEEYDIETWSVSASTVKAYGRRVRAELGFEFESVNITGVDEDEIPVIKQTDTLSARRKLYFSYYRDSRDHIFIPRTGSFSDVSAEYVGGFLGGDDNFMKIEASASTYDVIWPGWISATRVKVGWVGEFGESELVPSEDLFYLGGANTIRGFKEKSLGPTAEGFDDIGLGSNYQLVINQEFRWKTVQVLQALPWVGGFFETLPLWQSVFFDMGNGFTKFDEIRMDQNAFSYGTGVQMMSPAGPIRVDYARRIQTKRYEFDYRWHFTILYAF